MEGYLHQMRCGHHSECNRAGSMTTVGFYISYNSTCCNTNACSPPPPELPEKSLVKNGVTCPACHAERKNPCVPERSMACTGEETCCVFQNATLYSAYSVYSSGCATKTVLEDNGNFLNSFSLVTTFVMTEVNKKNQLQEGNFLWCHECQERHSSSCAKHQVLCPPERDVCLSEMRRITEDPSRRLTMQAVRRCGNSNECNVDGTITGRGMTVAIKTSCCNTDMCNPPSVLWSLKRKKNNGKTCPVSFPLNNYYYQDVVQCMGDETHCINLTTSIIEGPFHKTEMFQGCAMASICENGLTEEYHAVSDQIIIRNDIICSSGIMISHFVHLMLSSIIALTMLKD